jgi:hypothetical protein
VTPPNPLSGPDARAASVAEAVRRWERREMGGVALGLRRVQRSSPRSSVRIVGAADEHKRRDGAAAPCISNAARGHARACALRMRIALAHGNMGRTREQGARAAAERRCVLRGREGCARATDPRRDAGARAGPRPGEQNCGLARGPDRENGHAGADLEEQEQTRRAALQESGLRSRSRAGEPAP